MKQGVKKTITTTTTTTTTKESNFDTKRKVK